MNLSATTDFLLLYVKYISISSSCNHALIHCILAKSSPQMLSLKDGYILYFFNCLIIGLWSSSANCYFYKIDSCHYVSRSTNSFISMYHSELFIKKDITVGVSSPSYPSYFRFLAILQYHVILYQKVFFFVNF